MARRESPPSHMLCVLAHAPVVARLDAHVLAHTLVVARLDARVLLHMLTYCDRRPPHQSIVLDAVSQLQRYRLWCACGLLQ
jgi:hypothetical protein